MDPTAFQLQGILVPDPMSWGHRRRSWHCQPPQKGKETHHFQAIFLLKESRCTKNKNVKRRKAICFGLCSTGPHPVASHGRGPLSDADQIRSPHLRIGPGFCVFFFEEFWEELQEEFLEVKFGSWGG